MEQAVPSPDRAWVAAPVKSGDRIIVRSRATGQTRQLPLDPSSGPAELAWFGDNRHLAVATDQLVVFNVVQEQEWGKEIQALADLRLVHQIGNLSVQTGSYRGRPFVGFTLDLSNWTGTRSERISQIEFWTAGGRQEARRARLIYTPGASDRPASAAEPSEPEPKAADEELTGDRVQTDIFSLLSVEPAASRTSQPVETVELQDD